MGPPFGLSPSEQLASEQKSYSVVRDPAGVIAKSVPEPPTPPMSVEPYKFPLAACISIHASQALSRIESAIWFDRPGDSAFRPELNGLIS
jgi:hypothetical protein